MDIFEQWDNEFNIVVEETETPSKREEVPHDKYEVKINKMELTQSKSGKPMVSVWFKIIAGKWKGSMIFMNQVVTMAFHVHIINEFLSSLTSKCNVTPEIEFKNYKQYKDLILEIAELIDNKFEYALEYGENDKGYNTFKMLDVFEVK